jgi:sugar phosphate isomerase/epimerase
MRLAMSQIAWEAEQEAKALKILREFGFEGLEIAPPRVAGPQPYDHPEKAAEFARKMKEDFGLALCSMQSIWFGQSGNMFGPERQALLDYTKKAVLFAEAGGIGNLVFGNPKARVLPERQSSDAAIPFFKEIGDFAAAHGMVVALEANPPLYGTNFMNTTAQAFAMARRVGSPGCRVNLDYGTIMINNEEVSDLEGRVGEINHVHISAPELVAIEPEHGHRLLADLLRSEGYAGYVSVEMKAQPLEEVRRAAAYLAEVFA